MLQQFFRFVYTSYVNHGTIKKKKQFRVYTFTQEMTYKHIMAFSFLISFRSDTYDDENEHMWFSTVLVEHNLQATIYSKLYRDFLKCIKLS